MNVTNLLLARGAERRTEFAVRTALGASRLRIIRQLLAETLLLAVARRRLGIVLAHVAVDALLALSPPELPRVGAIAVDRPVLAFAAGLTTLIGLVVGLLPALPRLQRQRAGWRAATLDARRGRTSAHAAFARRRASRPRPRAARRGRTAAAKPAAPVRGASWLRPVRAADDAGADRRSAIQGRRHDASILRRRSSRRCSRCRASLRLRSRVSCR